MDTSVKTQAIVLISATLDEWMGKLADPQAFMIKIENAVFPHADTPNGHKPKARRSPKGKTARAPGTARASKTLICPVCEKKFKTQGRFDRHMDRNHTITAQPAGD